MELNVTDLAVSRGGLVVLAGVGFALAPGAALVLRGPNGVGKTTLLRTLAGLQPAVSGRISIPPESLAYASHSDGLKAVLTVEENLSFWASVHGLDRAAVGAAIEAMDLPALRSRRAADLSAGQKRRLGLARLLVTGRPVWLLDEPTVSLDAASVARFGDVVRGHLAGGGMAVMATHIDLGLPEAHVLDLAPFRVTARPVPAGGFDDGFGDDSGGGFA